MCVCVCMCKEDLPTLHVVLSVRTADVVERFASSSAAQC